MATTTALQTRERDALFFCQVTYGTFALAWGVVSLLYSCSNSAEYITIFHSIHQQPSGTIYLCTTLSQPSPLITSRFIFNSGITQIVRLMSCIPPECFKDMTCKFSVQKVWCLMRPLLRHVGFYTHGSAFIQESAKTHLLIITTALLYIGLATVTFSYHKQTAEYCRQNLT